MNVTKEQITFGLGLLGAVLGVINLWRAFDRDRVKLRVTPKTAMFIGSRDERDRLCIEVTNLSTFSVTVCEVGLKFWFHDTRMSMYRPILPDGKPWPRRLEPRETVTAYCEPEVAEVFRDRFVRRAFARTECGEWRYGNSKALKGYAKKARSGG